MLMNFQINEILEGYKLKGVIKIEYHSLFNCSEDPFSAIYIHKI